MPTHQKIGRYRDVVGDGIELVVDLVLGMESIYSDLSFRVGSYDERECEPRGIAHVLEHMPFKGTSRRAAASEA